MNPSIQPTQKVYFKATDPFNEKWRAPGLSLHPGTSLHLHCFILSAIRGTHHRPLKDMRKIFPFDLFYLGSDEVNNGENEIVSREAGYLHKLEQCYLSTVRICVPDKCPPN
ncbi:hypothetical protein Tco_1304275 [Tanacetum coccineum]